MRTPLFFFLMRKPLDSVVSSLSGVMSVLKIWSKEKFGNVLKEIEKLRREIEELQLVDASSDRIRAKMYELYELLYREEMMWLQRSRITWL